MIELGKFDAAHRNYRTAKGFTERHVNGGEKFRISKKGNFQWQWEERHKGYTWVTWAKIVYSNDRRTFQIIWTRKNAAWTEEAVAAALSLLSLVNQEWESQQ